MDDAPFWRRVDFGTVVFAIYFMALLLVPLPAYIAVESAQRGEIIGTIMGSLMVAGIAAGAGFAVVGFARYYRVGWIVPLALGSIPIVLTVAFMGIAMLGASPAVD